MSYANNLFAKSLNKSWCQLCDKKNGFRPINVESRSQIAATAINSHSN
jgi:hypothetical protein